MRLFVFLSCCLLTADLLAADKEIEGERKAAQTACPTPEEARAKMSVPEGYEVRCFAHEPMVQNPVAMTWDHRGRLWVVEAYEYPNGSEHPAPFGGEAKDDQYHPLPKTGDKIPRDRVVILEDTDNNGEADKRTVFVEGLNLASAILCGDNGIYIGQQPHLIHFRDDDGDDQPDAWRVVLTGFGREDTHELVNSFTWGPDGWLYMTHGVFTNSKVRRPGQPESAGFKFDAGIGRARPMSRDKEAKWEFEVFADGTSNPWGCDYDAAGNFFVSACVIDHFFHMAPGGIYVRQGGAPENPYAYEQLPSIVKHKHFRAAYAGVQIYQGGRYPADTHGHAFIGNIHDNAIHEEVLTPVGATFKCEPRRDFLRANDGWFRPVSTQTGPDGFLWIMDWCDKYPCYQNAKANPEGVDRERGRIWRVVYGQEKGARTLLSAASEASPKDA
ncbi:PVC-type heme-binding CxxCH protein, partial [Prosthecobacter sp.]